LRKKTSHSKIIYKFETQKLLHQSIKLIQGNSKINSSIFAWGALALEQRYALCEALCEALCACALQIIRILNKLRVFLPVKISPQETKHGKEFPWIKKIDFRDIHKFPKKLKISFRAIVEVDGNLCGALRHMRLKN
jgi:hypothetical protein